MSWDPFQHEVLDALGHALYRVAHDEGVQPDAMPVAAAAVGMAADPVRQPDRPMHALARALLRAAGRTPDAADAASLCAGWNLAMLREPAAKRGLWPQLRRLRRSGGQA